MHSFISLTICMSLPCIHAIHMAFALKNISCKMKPRPYIGKGGGCLFQSFRVLKQISMVIGGANYIVDKG